MVSLQFFRMQGKCHALLDAVRLGLESNSSLTQYTADGMNPRKATRRMIRWLNGPIDYNPPTFAKEPGEKENKPQSKL